MMNDSESKMNGLGESRTVENNIVSNRISEHRNEQNECAVGHRMQAVRSVLSLVVDEGCVFAGLQGGDIVVGACTMLTQKKVR